MSSNRASSTVGFLQPEEMHQTKGVLEHFEAQRRRHTGWCVRPGEEGSTLKSMTVYYYMEHGIWQFSVYYVANTWMWYHDGKWEGEALAVDSLEEAMRLAYTLWRMGE